MSPKMSPETPAPIVHALTILAVQDLQRAAGFYELLGFRRTVEAPVYIELALPGSPRLGLYQRESFAKVTGRAPVMVREGDLAPTELYFYVERLEELLAKLETAGARRLSALSARPWGDEAAYFADPDGNVVVLARPLPA